MKKPIPSRRNHDMFVNSKQEANASKYWTIFVTSQQNRTQMICNKRLEDTILESAMPDSSRSSLAA